MPSLRHWFSKYTGPLRQLKAVYVLNNFLNRKKLQHNEALYRKHGLHKSVLSPIGSQLFKEKSNDIPWLDRPDALDQLEQHPQFSEFSADIQHQLRHFVEQGYMVLKGFHEEAKVEQLNEEVAQALAAKKVNFNYSGRKVMEFFKTSELANRQFFRNERLLHLLSFVLGRPIIPFHTINFVEGSEQRAHSDFIHMSTEPQGYMIAAWTALEPIHEGNGPLFFYPGSHRLPYITTQDYDSGNTFLTIGSHSNEKFEDKIEQVILEHKLEKKYFYGEAGDVFIWHANLLHGGSPILHKGATRKSMVAHYFTEGAICYHEMTQRPAFLEKDQV